MRNPLPFATVPEPSETELDVEPVELEPEREPEVEPDHEPEPEASVEAVPALALMEVLPADFPLPALTRFVPDVRLRAAADQAAAYALGVEVSGPEGLQRADTALTALRASVKAIKTHFEEPAAIANELHKHVTELRSKWCAGASEAVETVGRRVYTEQRRLEAIAAEERRKAQEEEDRKVREAAKREAEIAAKAHAPAPVVEELQRQAQTATAPPVGRTSSAPAALKGSSTVERWKCRIAGTPADAEPNPEMDALTPQQRLQIFELLKAILDGRAPLVTITVNWSYANRRAGSDKSTLAIPGLEAFDAGGLRSKGTRGK